MSARNAVTLPRTGSRGRALLAAMLAGPGTLYQLAERSGLDADPDASEAMLRACLDAMLRNGAVKLDVITYSITLLARLAVTRTVAAAYVGQVATSHYRGPSMPMPVRVVRAARGVRS